MKNFSVYFIEGKDIRVNAKLIFRQSATISQRANKRKAGNTVDVLENGRQESSKEFQ